MAAVVEVPEGEPVTSVHIDGLALLKIVKHCQESLPQLVTGSLLGLMVENGRLEITHAFPFPDSDSASPSSNDLSKSKDDPSGEDEVSAQIGSIDGHEFQLEMMKMLREVNVDNNCVGWYQSMYLGSYSTHTLVENQLSYQTDLSPNAVVILYDPVQTAHGNLVLKCYRLTDECVQLQSSGRNTFIDPTKIFQELPVSFSNPLLVQAWLADVADTDSRSSSNEFSHKCLDLSTNPYLEKHLEFLCTWVDDLVTEQHKYQYFTRNAARMGSNDPKNKEKKKSAVQDGWNSRDAPKRMESLLITNQIRSYCDQMERFAGGGAGKLFLAGGLHRKDEESNTSS